MIRYDLICNHEHRFDGWFRSSADFDVQNGEGHVTCPQCGSNEIEKALMAPGIPAKGSREARPVAGGALPAEAVEAMRKIRQAVEQNADYVGERFPEEARKIHYEETEARGIYGEASGEEVKELCEEGIAIQPLPVLPEDKN